MFEDAEENHLAGATRRSENSKDETPQKDFTRGLRFGEAPKPASGEPPSSSDGGKDHEGDGMLPGGGGVH